MSYPKIYVKFFGIPKITTTNDNTLNSREEDLDTKQYLVMFACLACAFRDQNDYVEKRQILHALGLITNFQATDKEIKDEPIDPHIARIQTEILNYVEKSEFSGKGDLRTYYVKQNHLHIQFKDIKSDVEEFYILHKKFREDKISSRQVNTSTIEDALAIANNQTFLDVKVNFSRYNENFRKWVEDKRNDIQQKVRELEIYLQELRSEKPEAFVSPQSSPSQNAPENEELKAAKTKLEAGSEELKAAKAILEAENKELIDIKTQLVAPHNTGVTIIPTP